jgi:hypothetical protein
MQRQLADWGPDATGIRDVEPQKESVLRPGIDFDAKLHNVGPRKGDCGV